MIYTKEKLFQKLMRQKDVATNRNKNSAGVFDIQMRPNEMKSLKESLIDSGLQVELRRCPAGLYDIIISWENAS